MTSSLMDKKTERLIKLVRKIQVDSKNIDELLLDLKIQKSTLLSDISYVNFLFNDTACISINKNDVCLHLDDRVESSDIFFKLVCSSPHQMILNLLYKKNRTIIELSEYLFVSVSTIRRYIEKINRSLRARGLDIYIDLGKKDRRIIQILGDEQEIRLLAISFLEEYPTMLYHDKISEAIKNYFNKIFDEPCNVNYLSKFYCQWIHVSLYRISNGYLLKKKEINKENSIVKGIIENISESMSNIDLLIKTKFKVDIKNKEVLDDLLSLESYFLFDRALDSKNCLNIKSINQLLNKMFERLNMTYKKNEEIERDIFMHLSFYRITYYEIDQSKINWEIMLNEKKYVTNIFMDSINSIKYFLDMKEEQLLYLFYLLCQYFPSLIYSDNCEKKILLLCFNNQRLFHVYHYYFSKLFPFKNNLEIESVIPSEINRSQLKTKDVVLTDFPIKGINEITYYKAPTIITRPFINKIESFFKENIN